jgi:hypothetical protein
VGGFSFGGEAFCWHCSYALKLCNAAAAAVSRCDEDWGFIATAGHYCRRRAALISSQGREEASGGRIYVLIRCWRRMMIEEALLWMLQQKLGAAAGIYDRFLGRSSFLLLSLFFSRGITMR